MNYQRGIQTEVCEALQALRNRHDQRRRGFRPQYLKRMRIECNHRGDLMFAPRALNDCPKDFLMPGVQAVEVAHGDHRAALSAHRGAPFRSGMRYAERH
jgi:hypothetical protein